MANLLENDLLGSIGTQTYLCQIEWRNGTLLMDEPERLGGQDLGPDPYSTLLAALAGCTLSTLRMYIDRKGWDIPKIGIRLNLEIRTDGQHLTQIKRDITFGETLPEDMRKRLLAIAAKCPVSKILENEVVIHTTL